MKAIIIGGGIGGLASAVALARRGWQVEVLERAPEFTEVGAGLSVWANGVRALDALGVGESVRRHAALEGQGGIQDSAHRQPRCALGPGLSGRRVGNGAASRARG